MDNGSQSALALIRCPQGGYLVTDMWSDGTVRTYQFAATSIDDALKYMRDKVAPIAPQQNPAG